MTPFAYKTGETIRLGDLVQIGRGEARWIVKGLMTHVHGPMIALEQHEGYNTTSVIGVAGVSRLTLISRAES